MGSGKLARAGWLLAVTVACGASLVCGPAVSLTAQVPAGIDIGSSPALALVAAPSVRTQDTTATTLPVAPAAAAPFVVPSSPDQWFQPAGKNHGTEGLAMFLAGLALRDNAPLYISDTTRTTGPTTSDHHISRTDSWAVDVAVRGIQQPTPATYEAARRISTALGVPGWPGGDLTKIVNGYRIQVLWLVAGHYNHVHVGVRKVG